MEYMVLGIFIMLIVSVVFDAASMHVDRKNMRRQREVYQEGVALAVKDVHELYELVSKLDSADIRSVEYASNDSEHAVQVFGNEASHCYYIRDGMIYVDYPEEINFLNRGLFAIFRHLRFQK